MEKIEGISIGEVLPGEDTGIGKSKAVVCEMVVGVATQVVDLKFWKTVFGFRTGIRLRQNLYLWLRSDRGEAREWGRQCFLWMLIHDSIPQPCNVTLMPRLKAAEY